MLMTTLGFKVYAINHRTNMVAGKMLTQSRFLRKGDPNHVNTDLKRSPSNLTLGQCKLDLRQSQKCLSCVALNIIRLVLMGQGCFYYSMLWYILRIKRRLRKRKPMLGKKMYLYCIYIESERENCEVIFD